MNRREFLHSASILLASAAAFPTAALAGETSFPLVRTP